MRTPVRLAGYGLALAVVFAGSFGLAGAVVPDEVSQRWADQGQHPAGSDESDHGSRGLDESDHGSRGHQQGEGHGSTEEGQ